MQSRSEEGLLKTFENFKKALFTCDRHKLDQIIAADYRGFTIYGSFEDRTTILNAYGDNQIKLENYDVQDMQAEIIGEIGIISGLGYIRGSYDGYVFEHHVRFLDIYRFRKRIWQLYLTQITELKQF